MRAVPHFDLWWEFEFGQVEVDTSMGWLSIRGKLDGGCRVDALKLDDVEIHDGDDEGEWRDLSWSEGERFRSATVQREVFSHVNKLVQEWAAKGGE
jgi:hypothetical protein